ncbi:MAG: DUF1989 domain-containing protein [Rhizobiales bacterium]|nr:DUF1989 domain-containing protein [Hyphomicrobiales bacterium]
MQVRPRFETPYERRGVLVPGVPILPHGVERHPVPGGGSRAIAIGQGDEITILDVAGLQRGEIVFFAPDGTSDAGMIGAKGHGRARGLEAALCADDASGARVARALAAAGFDLARADGAHVFGAGSRAGDMETFHAARDGLLIVAAPGGPMTPDAQDAPSELVVYIRRANPGPAKAGRGAPEPLADPLLDINIQPGEAATYQVKAGQFIQILDVEGRECTDFQAFSLRALDKGLERDIDPTTTRSLMGRAYPTPGLHSKYFTVDHEPLVEIVQDTCGRHDAFGLACTARYYEDMGYPGHVNCSDNISARLAGHGVRPKGGWPAINFFFNTMLDDTHALGLDDPWSRPGDYVLLRAASDLLCVSSACPCDIDPSNGWNPTDIQVRVYGANESFLPSVGWRRSVEGEVQATRKTGFHDCFARFTRDFREYNGYWLAHQMTSEGAIAEYWACREKAAIMDLSPLRKVEVLGPDAEALMQLCLTRDVRRLSPGRVVYAAMCHEHGGMIDDGTLFRLAENNFRWIGGNDRGAEWLCEVAAGRGLDVWVRPSSEQLANVAVQGPLSREVLGPLVWTPATRPRVDELGWFHFTVGRIGDYSGPAVVVSRTGYTGELGYEVFCHPKDATAVFDAIFAAGEPKGLKPIGLGALDMLRIEAGLAFAGHEFDERTDPFEAGLGFAVAFASKTDDFIGGPALRERAAHPQRHLVGLDIEGGVVPGKGDPVRMGKAHVGAVTSAMRSPVLGRVIALARIDVPHTAPGTRVNVGKLDGEQKLLAATVTTMPHFDPEKRRVRGLYDR